MTRRTALAIVTAVAAGMVFPHPAVAASSADEVKAALLTSAQAKRASGTHDPLTTVDSWCSYPSKGTGVVTCSRSWPGDLDSTVIPTEARIAHHPSATAAKNAFHSVTREDLADAADSGMGVTVVTSTPSTLLFIVGTPRSGPPPFYLGVGYRQVGTVLISVSCDTSGPVTSVSAINCTRRLLNAQVAKARRLAG